MGIRATAARRPPGGGDGGHARQRHVGGDGPPRQVEPVDAVLDDRLQAGRERHPSGQTDRGADRGGGDTDDGAVGQRDEPHMAVGGTERREHAQGAQAALGHHGEPGHGQQPDKEQPDRRQDQHEGLGRRPAGGSPGGDIDARATREVERLQAVRCAVDQDRHAGGRVGLAGRHQGELVQQVQGVFDQTDDLQCPGSLVPDAADVQVVGGGDVAGHGDLVGTGRVPPGVEPHRHMDVRAAGVLGPHVRGGHRPRQRQWSDGRRRRWCRTGSGGRPGPPSGRDRSQAG